MNRQQNAHLNLLLQQGRYPEAETALRTVLTEGPDNAEALLLMAMVLHFQDKEDQALGAVNLVLRIEPESDRAHAWKSRILAAMEEYPQAMQSAQKALELDVQDPFNFITRGNIHAARREWAAAEADARSALELDPDYDGAHHLLSQTLLFQGKAHENEGNIANRLMEDPENPLAHCNAGYAALRRGDHRKASEHFAAALQIDAECGMAREGLIESFRARSLIYRLYLQFSFRMAALSEKYGMGLMLGIYFIYRFLRVGLEKVDPRLSQGLVVLYMSFVLWTYVARGVSTFFLLADGFARMALRTREKLEALVVGGGFAVGLVLLLSGLGFDFDPLMLTGGALLVQSIPASLFFERDSKTGRMVYGGFAGVTWVCSAIVIVGAWTEWLPAGVVGTATVVGVAAMGISTFCALFGVAKR